MAWSLYAHDSLEAELQAINNTLIWLQSKIWNPCIIVSDCLVAVQLISNNWDTNSRHKTMNLNCRELLNSIPGARLNFEGRSTNKAADALAKNSRKQFVLCNQACILNSLPLVCLSFLVEDSPNFSCVEPGHVCANDSSNSMSVFLRGENSSRPNSSAN